MRETFVFRRISAPHDRRLTLDTDEVRFVPGGPDDAVTVTAAI
jgi:hypothetical protein